MRKKLVILSILAIFFSMILSTPTLTISSNSNVKDVITVNVPKARHLANDGNDPKPELDKDPCPSIIYPNSFNSSAEC